MESIFANNKAIIIEFYLKTKKLIAYPTAIFHNRFKYIDFKSKQARYVARRVIKKIFVPNVKGITIDDYLLVKDYFNNTISKEQFSLEIRRRRFIDEQREGLTYNTAFDFKSLNISETLIEMSERLSTLVHENEQLRLQLKGKPLCFPQATQTESISTTTIVPINNIVDKRTSIGVQTNMTEASDEAKNNEDRKKIVSNANHSTRQPSNEKKSKPRSQRRREHKRKMEYEAKKRIQQIQFVKPQEPELSDLSDIKVSSDSELLRIAKNKEKKSEPQTTHSSPVAMYQDFYALNVLRNAKINLKLISCLYTLSKCKGVECTEAHILTRHVCAFDILMNSGINPNDENFSPLRLYNVLKDRFNVNEYLLESVRFTLPEGLYVERIYEHRHTLHQWCEHRLKEQQII